MSESAKLTFVSTPTTILGQTAFKPGTQWRHNQHYRHARNRLRACLPPNKATDSTDSEAPSGAPARKLSKSEEMALQLGQDTGKLREKAAKQKEEVEVSKQTRYAMAAASLLISGGLFLVQRLDPHGNINLMKYMVESSAPVEVVGTNGRPTMIEFSASYCENCKAMARRVFELENEYVERVNFVVIDGEDPQRQEIVDKFGVDAIPQFAMVGGDGVVKGNLVGMVPKDVLKKDLDALLGDTGLPFPGLALDRLGGLR